MEHKVDSNTQCNLCTWNNPEKGLEDLETRGQVKAITKIKQNTGDLRRLAVTKSPVKNHQQTLV